MTGISVDRGVEIRHTPEGVAVYMYTDTPGVFYNEHGVEVGPRAAGMAGYAVESLTRERKKREAITKAGEVAAASFHEITRDVVDEKGDYRIVHIGADRHNVEFSDGSVMNLNGPVPLGVARTIMEALQPETPPEQEPEKPAKK